MAVPVEQWIVGEARPLSTAPRALVHVTPRTEPYVCPAIRVTGCPCGAAVGQRCIGIDLDDQVHIERVWRSLARE